MRKDEFNSRKLRNEIRGGKSGSQFNASRKQERHKEAPQFAAKKVEGIRRVSEYRDARARARNSRAGSASASGAKSNLTTALVRQAVVMVAGAVVVTSSYQTAVAEREEREALRERAFSVEAVAAAHGIDLTGVADGTCVWVWEEDSESALLLIPGVGFAEATVTVEEEAPGCVTPGLRTHTATAVIGKETYTDAQTEEIPATGHSFGEPQVTTDADGNPVIRAHCSGCDQDFEIGYTIEKEG